MAKKFNLPDFVLLFRLYKLKKLNPLISENRKGYYRKSLYYAGKTSKMIRKGMSGIGEEASETKVMAESFFKMLEHKLDMKNRKEPPTEEEVKAAIEQLKDVGRFSLFATISIIPGGGFSLIGLELLARKMGVKRFTLVPSAFRKKDSGDDGDAIIIRKNK